MVLVLDTNKGDKQMLSTREKTELAAKVDLNGYNFGSLESAAEFVGETVPDEHDEVALMKFAFKVQAKMAVECVNAIEKEVMSNV